MYDRSRRPAKRRPLKPGEVRVRYETLPNSPPNTIIYSREHGDQATFARIHRERCAQQRAEEEREAKKLLPVLRELVTAAQLASPRPDLSIRMTSIYLANTVWGWNLTRCGRAFACHRTAASYYVSRIEDARDDRIYDDALTTLEDALNDNA